MMQENSRKKKIESFSIWKRLLFLCCVVLICTYSMLRKWVYVYAYRYSDVDIYHFFVFLPQMIFCILLFVFTLQIQKILLKNKYLFLFRAMALIWSISVSLLLYTCDFHDDVFLVGGAILCLIIGVIELLNREQKPSQVILLVNKDGLLKECPYGFSWGVFWLGWFIPAIKGDIKWMIILFLISLTGIGLLFNCLWFSANYNRLYIRDYLEKGFVPFDDRAENILKEMKIYYAS